MWEIVTAGQTSVESGRNCSLKISFWVLKRSVFCGWIFFHSILDLPGGKVQYMYIYITFCRYQCTYKFSYSNIYIYVYKQINDNKCIRKQN